MVFTENQATQVYVVKNDTSAVQYAAKTETAAAVTVANLTTEGAIGYPGTPKNDFYINQKGYGGLVRSDLVSLNNIMHISYTTAAKMREPLKHVEVKLDSDVSTVPGQDYVLNMNIRQYVGISDEEVQIKTAVAHCFKGDSESTLLARLAASLWMNMSRELVPLVDIYVNSVSEDNKVTGVVTDSNKKKVIAHNGVAFDLNTVTVSSLILVEAIQEWTLGIKEQTKVYFDVFPSTIYADGDEVTWGTAEDTTPTQATVATAADTLKNVTYVTNAHKICDMEYFFMGERADQYRNIMWPKSIPTKYFADADTEYNTLQIHYYYVGDNEGAQKSEKDILLVAKEGSTLTTLATVLTGANSNIKYYVDGVLQ